MTTLAHAIRNWLARDLWGEPAHEATSEAMAATSDAELAAGLFEAGVGRLFPSAGRAEVQGVLDDVREEHRLRTIWGAVEMERRRRGA